MQAQDKLIYVGDPMCSWCYGFSPELEKLVHDIDSEVEVDIVMGGLRPYYQQPITEMKDFLSHHWEDVHKASGQPFSYDILDREGLNYDTEPACRAVVVVRAMDASKTLDFFKQVQKAFYYDNKDLRQVSSYTDILESLNLDVADFATKFDQEEYKALVKSDFQRARDIGVNSFPTVLLQQGDKVTVVGKGYAKSDRLKEAIAKLRT